MDNQKLTKAAYEDSQIVEGYIQRNSLDPKLRPAVKKLAKLIRGKKVLDLGCGPGHNAYIFHELGFDVTGLDYSGEMIKRAKTFKKVANPPKFIVGDMRKLTHYFAPNQFDAIWAAGSLFHVKKSQLPGVLASLKIISKPKAVFFATIKSGKDSQLVSEDFLGKPISREFTFYSKQEFQKLAQEQGFKLIDFHKNKGRVFLGKPTNWLQFIFRLDK